MDELNRIKKYKGGAEEFALSGEYHVFMESNYDGDTATLVFWLFKKYMKFNCQLYGLNAGKIRGAKSDEEKKMAVAAKEYLAQYNGKILKCIVHAECKDPYKRPIVELFDGENNINTQMLAKGLVGEYYGHGEKAFK
jgi:endonuclease YncB( thermonuclease family)